MKWKNRNVHWFGDAIFSRALRHNLNRVNAISAKDSIGGFCPIGVITLAAATSLCPLFGRLLNFRVAG